jgi:hypothetical protein
MQKVSEFEIPLELAVQAISNHKGGQKMGHTNMQSKNLIFSLQGIIQQPKVSLKLSQEVLKSILSFIVDYYDHVSQ